MLLVLLCLVLQAHAAERVSACGCRHSRQCQQDEVNTGHEDGPVRQHGVHTSCGPAPGGMCRGS
jgi:hypothetical protein